MPPVTNPHSTPAYTYTCEACNPPATINADTQRALDKLVAEHNATYHPAP